MLISWRLRWYFTVRCRPFFWYDKPSAYRGEPEIEWFENLPTIFDDSKVLSGHPGKGIVMARRKEKEWFVGLLTNNDGAEEDVPLSFLEEGRHIWLKYIRMAEKR